MDTYLKSLNLKSPHGASIVESNEIQPLAEFRTRVKGIYPLADVKLLAWLRARNLDVDKAEQMLRRHLIWRKHNEINKLILWESPKSFFPYLHSGFDKDGTPIFILPIGHWDIKGTIETGDMLPSLKFIYQTLETLVSAGAIVDIHQGFVICDFDGFSYSQIAHRTVIQGMIETVRAFEANYPEILKQCYVINAPVIFNIVYALVKPLLHSRTLSKIQIFKSDPTKWKQALLEGIDKSQLPPHWGGTRIGSDEYCSEAWLTSPLPPYYFRKTSAFFDDYGEEWWSLKIAGNEILTFPYTVNEGKHSGKVLAWSFYIENSSYGGNTGLDLVILENTKSIPILEKLGLITSENKKETGSIKLNEIGKYVLKIQNKSNKQKTFNYSLSFSTNESGTMEN